MDLKIVQDFIPTSNINRPQYTLVPIYITIHETANTSDGANAAMHARYVKNPTTAASWHFTVDDRDTVYQHLPLTENGWHAGDGGSGTGNRQSIGIEICVNRDGNLDKATQNAITLTKSLMEQFKIPVNNVVPHKRWSGKNCPTNLLSKFDWFKSQLTNKQDKVEVTKPAPTPSKGANMTTGSIVTYLNSIGVESSYNNRARLASRHGISNYSGTAEQNTQLLGILRDQGAKAPATPPNPKPQPAAKGNMTTGSIVTYLNSIGVDSSYENRERLAKQHGINGYSGTANQNTRLLNILRNGGSTAAPSKSNKPAVRPGEGIVSWMNRAGMDSSYRNRERLAKEYSIANYSGTATQNSRLLNILSK